jgi:hypothetical protein
MENVMASQCPFYLSCDRLVRECLGKTALLGVVGSPRTGKSWAAHDWAIGRRDDIEPAAYVECLAPGFSVSYSLGSGGGVRLLRGDSYPRHALDGIDIVVVDEPARCLPFVQTLLALSTPVSGMAAHRLVVLLLQDIRLLRAFALRKGGFRCFDTCGAPIIDVIS